MTTAWPCAAATCHRTLRDHELAGEQTLCTPCVSTVRAWLLEIPNQIIVLGGSLQRETTGTTGGRGTQAPALPGGDALNLLGPAATGTVRDEHGDQHGAVPIVGILGSWVRLTCEERRWNGPGAVGPEALATWLAAARPLDWACRRPWAGEYRDEVWSLVRSIRGITRLRPQTRPVAQPCPRCDSLTLSETDHQLYVDCGACESRFTREELSLAARISAATLGAA